MIVSIRDSQPMSDNAISLTAVISAITAIAKSKKTLVIQLTPSKVESVLNYLYGKTLKEQDLSSVYRRYEDDGLDALFIRAETTDLTTEHFNDCATPIFEKENLLDILKPTKQIEYKKIINIENLKDIAKSAQETYDYVYILSPFDDPEIMDRVREIADENIVTVPQGHCINETLDEKDTIVVCDFEFTSRFDQKYMKKAYGVKKLYYMPHNVEFKDSIITQNILDFVLKNKKDMKEDNNYSFVYSLLSLVNKYVVGVETEDEEININRKNKADYEQGINELTEIPGENVQEVTVKVGRFKKTKKMMINI